MMIPNSYHGLILTQIYKFLIKIAEYMQIEYRIFNLTKVLWVDTLTLC